MKRVLSSVLTLSLAMSLAVPAMAQDVEETNLLATEEVVETVVTEETTDVVEVEETETEETEVEETEAEETEVEETEAEETETEETEAEEAEAEETEAEEATEEVTEVEEVEEVEEVPTEWAYPEQVADFFAQQDGEVATMDTAIAYVLKYAGMEESQLGSFPYDYVQMAKSVGIIGNDYLGTATATEEAVSDMLVKAQVLLSAMTADVREPLFVDGMAQPIYNYNDVQRFVVYVETDYDTDGDGKLDLVKTLVQLPAEALEDGVTMPIIYEARPYIAGTNITSGNANEKYESWDTYATYEGFDLEDLYAQPEARTPASVGTTQDAIDATSPEDYDYTYIKGDYTTTDEDGNVTVEEMSEEVYENLNWYDYYVVRGFAVVTTAGIGTYGSEGYELCGTDLEIDAFAAVIEWLNGNKKAYLDKESNIEISAEDWSNGKVGMTGRSYAGTTQFGLASMGVEGLETIVPVAGIASWYEYTNAQGVYTRNSAAYTQGLGWFCNSRFFGGNNEDWDSIVEGYGAFMGEMYELQVEANGDYTGTWAIMDYTLTAEERAELIELGFLTDRYQIGTDKITAPALIVHGLNDFNVRTKQSDLMYKSYMDAGVNAKLLFHQGQHLTPTYPAGEMSMYVGYGDDVILYDELLNLWFSHYLFGIENGVENMPAVTAQSNTNINDWDSYDTWTASEELVLSFADVAEEATFGYVGTVEDEKVDNSLTLSFPAEEGYNIYGSIVVELTGSFDLGEGEATDAVRVAVTANETATEEFTAFNGSTSKDDRTVLVENGAWMGGGAANYDLTVYSPYQTTENKISDGFIDLFNPTAGYKSVETIKTEVAVEGETYTYTIYLQPTIHEIPTGHTMELNLSFTTANGETVVFNVDTEASQVIVPVMPLADEAVVVFTDVAKGTWYYDAVYAAVETALMQGTGNNAFTPDATVTHATICTVLANMSDVDTDGGDVWYEKAVAWAVEAGLTDGETPNDVITREEFVAMLYKFAGEPETAEVVSSYADGATVEAVDAFSWAINEGIVSGTGDNNLSPDATMTRAQMAVIFNRF